MTAPTTTTPWSAVSNDGWIVLPSPTGGTGSRLVTYEVRANFTGHFRVGTLTIAQRTHTVLQSGVAAGSCENSIAPGGAGFESGGGLGSVTVTAGSECIWTAAAKAGWITLTSSAVGIGNGSVSYTVDANKTGSARKGAISIAGRTFTIKQK